MCAKHLNTRVSFQQSVGGQVAQILAQVMVKSLTGGCGAWVGRGGGDTGAEGGGGGGVVGGGGGWGGGRVFSQQGSENTNLSMVLAAASLFRMQLVNKISFLAGQHSHLLLHALHLVPDFICAALKPAAQLSIGVVHVHQKACSVARLVQH